MNVSIIGAGNVGSAMAADLLQKGYTVTLYAHPDHSDNLNVIKANGGIKTTGEISGFIKVNKLTSNIQEAISNAKYIFITLPARAQNNFLIDALPYLQESQSLINLCGHFAPFNFLKILREHNYIKHINILETASSPYTSRSNRQGEVRLMARKKNLPIAACKEPGPSIKKELNSIFSGNLIWTNNLFAVGLQNINGITHPVGTLLNTGWIENLQEDFYFYKQGVSKSIQNLAEKIDQERVSICKALNLKTTSYLEIVNNFYTTTFSKLDDYVKKSSVLNKEKLRPYSLQHRYISEDIPYVLVPWYSLGCALGLTLETMRTIIDLGSLLNNTNYLQTGRNAAALGIENLSAEEIRSMFN